MNVIHQVSYENDAGIPNVHEVYASAVAEHQELGTFDKDRVFALVAQALSRIATFEVAARERIAISGETAEDIGTVWVHSGTGNYDQPVKPDDNPRLKAIPWMAGQDRARLNRGAYLVRRIAEVRSGQDVDIEPLRSIASRKEATRERIAAFGPTLFYSGYPSETNFVRRLLERPGGIMPAEKVHILDLPLQTTTDAVRTFAYANTEEYAKNVAIVSHAPHLGARILHMLQHFQPLSAGSVPYVSPVATPKEGLHDFACMESAGLLYYALLENVAAEEPHAYQTLH